MREGWGREIVIEILYCIHKRRNLVIQKRTIFHDYSTADSGTYLESGLLEVRVGCARTEL